MEFTLTLKHIFKKLICLLGFFLVATTNCSYATTDEAISPPDELTILFTHDVHSNLDAFAKAKTVIDETRAITPEILLIDGGDFSMGTLYQTIFEENATELRTLGKLGYDGVVIGNHEFDYRLSGLTNMLKAAQSFGEPLPQVFLSNVNWDTFTSPDVKAFKAVLDSMNYKEYTIIEKNGVKIAMFGLLGREAVSYAPLSGLTFDDFLGKAQKIVNEIKENEDVDLIVCLSHTGTKPNIKKSEDHMLAKNIPEIDVIISSHSHTYLREPVIVGNTIIASVGSKGKRLGKLHLKIDKKNKENKVELNDYEVVNLNASITSNRDIVNFLRQSKTKIKEEFLKPYGYDFDQILAYNPYRFTPYVNFAEDQDEYPLGNIVADAYVHAVKEAEGKNYEKIDVAFVSSGVVRASLRRGNISVSDVFKVSSLGVGADGTTGYPLVSGYLSGKELKTLAEVDASISTLMPTVKLFMSGMTYSFNPKRMLLNRVVDVKIESEPKVYQEIDDKKLYRVVTGLYSTQMLNTLEVKSKGLLKISPKDKAGKVIKDFEEHIIRNETGELKEWIALANYLESFEKIDGISTIPEIYKDAQGRKIVLEKNDVVSVVSNPNMFTLIFMGIALAAGISILGLILLITIVLKKKNRRKKASKISQIERIDKDEQ